MSQYQRTSGDSVANILDAYEPLLNNSTEGKFTTHVSTNYKKKNYIHALDIHPLFFKGYQYRLLEVTTTSQTELYPLTVKYHGLTKKRKYICVDERQYLELVETLLESSMTNSILKRIEAAYSNYLSK